MPAPPEPAGGHRGAAAVPAGVSWPVTADVGPRPPRADAVAALLAFVAGAAGLGQIFLSWSSTVTGVGLKDTSGGITGWERYQAARAAGSLSVRDTVTAFSVVGTAMAGAALILLALGLLAPIDHRPLGVVALVSSLVALSSAGWWLARGHHTFNQSIGELFTAAGPGWYLFLVAGPIGMVGAAKAITTG